MRSRHAIADPHLALCCGGGGDLNCEGNPIVHEEPVLVRVEFEGITGHVFHSARCDCGEQLRAALRMVQEAGRGAMVYLRQEGRGIGLRQLRIPTNNPKKVNRLEVYGVSIAEQHNLEIQPNDHSSFYLKTKRQKPGHQLREV